MIESEYERLNSFPHEIPSEDLIIYFTLSSEDMEQVPPKTAPYNRLGFAFQLGTLRYLGFCPDDLYMAPANVVTYVREQLEVTNRGGLEKYGTRSQTRSDHFKQIINYLGFRKASSTNLKNLTLWLKERALEHDNPFLLLQPAIERLHTDKIVRPGLTRLERVISIARENAYKEIFLALSPILETVGTKLLDSLLIRDKTLGRTPLSWLRYGSVGVSPRSILGSIEKLSRLRKWGVDGWDLTMLNPNRMKVLAQIARKSTNQVLQRTSEEKRYPYLARLFTSSA